ncbi:MAG: ribosome small subunit-dependent GTPase A [Chitinophagaceae bacterium]
MKALVYKSTGSWYMVKNPEGEVFQARIKGIFKINGITSTNPIAVGDEVNVETENELESSVTITGIDDRKNYIARVSPHNKNQHHIVASNLDQCMLFATLRDPKTSLGFIDRFLVTSEAYHIPAIIVINKADLFRKKEQEQFDMMEKMYGQAGYRIIAISVKDLAGMDDVAEILKDKITLLSGHSGVGKSSFINVLFPNLKLKTKDVSDWSGKGMHTTTFAEMFDLPEGGKIIDTPGIRELGLVDISRQELSHYYPEMRALINDCQFNNCLHINEPGCAVTDAVAKGKISEERYITYRNMLETIEERSY